MIHIPYLQYPCTVYLGGPISMVNNSCCVIDGVIGVGAVGREHKVDFICRPIQVLEDASSVVKTNAKVSLCVCMCVCVREKEKEKKRERERERE